MKKIQLIITSGIPGSGKTTWSKKMESENWIRVSTDDIRYEIFKDKFNIFDINQNYEVWETFTERIREAILEISSKEVGKKGVICDCMALSIKYKGCNSATKNIT